VSSSGIPEAPRAQPFGDPPRPRLGLVTTITCLLLLFAGLTIIAGGMVIGGWYFGPSGKTTAEVIAVNDGRPTVEYTVGGNTYRKATTEHGPQFEVGQTVELCYNPADPAIAETCLARVVMTVFCTAGAVPLLVAVAILLVAQARRQRRAAIIGQGHFVMAQITGSRGHPLVHIGNKILWRLSCAWTDPATQLTHAFTSPPLWSVADPAQILAGRGIESLPVFIDSARPDKDYYVHAGQTDFT